MYQRLKQRLEQLPLVLCGPILRHTTRNEVSVWLVLKEAATVTLHIYPTTDKGQRTETPILQGQKQSQAFGQNLHIVLVRAAQNGEPLESGDLYAYDLNFQLQDGSHLDFQQATGDLPGLCYQPHDRPTFMLPPENLADVHLLYGSCRKPHGEGIDALAGTDKLLEDATAQRMPRHQHLYLSGDQIYADDVADAFLYEITHSLGPLIGGNERFPGKMKAHWLRIGHRYRTCHKRAGFTSIYCKSHLFGLGEYLLMYCMVWSPVLWSEDGPTFEQVYPDRAFFPPLLRKTFLARHKRLGLSRKFLLKRFTQEQTNLNRFRAGLPAVRRVLANITTYMIFDDHEITDDWYLNRKWTARTLRRPLGRRVLLNGQLAYAICQGWGNAPERFLKGPCNDLLEKTSQWIENDFNWDKVPELERLIGMPKGTKTMRGLERNPATTCQWDYRVEGPSFEVWVLDTRTWRGFPTGHHDGIPDLISGDGWAQLSTPCRQSSKVTFVVAPTNVIDVPFTAWISKVAAHLVDATFADYGDTWEAQTAAFEELLGRLASMAGPGNHNFIFLSGDVHYAFATRIHYWANHPYKNLPLDAPNNTVLAQLTSSPLHNENGMTRFFQERGYWPRFPKPHAWAGWNHLPLVHIGSMRGHLKSLVLGLKRRSVRHEPPLLNLENLPRKITKIEPAPDWRYRVDYLHGERTPHDLVPDHHGSQIVGTNNIGELHFQWDDDHHEVVQRLWWFPGTSPDMEPLTAFKISLDHEETDFPKPKLPYE